MMGSIASACHANVETFSTSVSTQNAFQLSRHLFDRLVFSIFGATEQARERFDAGDRFCTFESDLHPKDSVSQGGT